jgi:glycolate oxidase
MGLVEGLVEDLAGALPAGSVITDPSVVSAYAGDQARWVRPGQPLVVVLPRSTAEVQAVVRVAASHRVPVVPRGAGTGLSGGAAAIDGCVVLCLSRMDKVLEVDADNQLIVVQPGVLNVDVGRAAASVGLWYPPDPSSFEISSIGGNLATNAGGLCCVKYGVTADFVLGLEVVLADGTAVRLGRRTIKGVAGYDLVRLFVGSEGTLGIITEATLRLRPRRVVPATLTAFFPSLDGAGAAVAGAVRAADVSLLELMDQTTVAAVDDWKRMDLDRSAAALLAAQADDLDVVALVCKEAGATFVAQSTDEDEAAMLLAARRLAYPALERLGATLLDDVAVPRAAVPALIAAVSSIGASRGLVIGTFGHAGDGNLHPTIVYDGSSASSLAAARSAFDDIVAVALRLGGTVTGEHGVGVLKREWLAQELGPDALALHYTVKNALDPLGILNPGKVLA